MNLSIGIIGLPNVGKSTLFNAITNSKVDASNYPFCTIEPNKGVVFVPDIKLETLASIEKSQKIVPAVIEFVDIAGLVKGASNGAGLGNKFLSHIREVAAIVHVVRNFEDTDVIHVDGKIDPSNDIDTIETELILKDLETLKKRIDAYKKFNKLDPKVQEEKKWLDELNEFLGNGKLASKFPLSEKENIRELRRSLFLITDKPLIVLFNIKDKDETLKLDNQKLENIHYIKLNIKLEHELSELEKEEKKIYIKEFGLEYSGLELLIKKSYEMLDLISFYTVGEKEARAWTIKKGMKIPEASGVIHTDFQRKFIAADVVSYEDFVNNGGWIGSKETGKVRLEGKEYVVKEGDIIIVRHG